MMYSNIGLSFRWKLPLKAPFIIFMHVPTLRKYPPVVQTKHILAMQNKCQLPQLNNTRILEEKNLGTLSPYIGCVVMFCITFTVGWCKGVLPYVPASLHIETGIFPDWPGYIQTFMYRSVPLNTLQFPVDF